MNKEKIPSKEDYGYFIEEFRKGIKKEISDSCFYIFGSMVNGNCNYGRSDIDGGLILNSDIKTPKDKILNIAEIFARITEETNITTQFNLLDRKTNNDGRFLSYTKDYTDWIKKSGKIIYGSDYIKEMKGYDFKSGVLYSTGYNFSGPGGIRNTVLNSIYLLRNDKDEFQKRVIKSLDKLVKFPKKFLLLQGREVIPSRKESRKELSKTLEDVNWDFIDKVNLIFDKEAFKFYETLSEENIALDYLVNSLTCAEELITSYIKHFPKISSNELRL